MAAATRHALFRSDASPAIGGGHVMRCLTLADMLVEKGWRCSFACTQETPETVPALVRSQHSIHLIPAQSAADPEALPQDRYDLMVIDHYGLDAEYERAARASAARIFVIDDLADRPHDCDLLLDQTLGRKVEDYRTFVPNHARILTGPMYALLKPAFAQLRQRRLSTLECPLKRIFVFFGLGDPDGTTLTALNGLAECGQTLSADIVVGAKAPHLAKIKERAFELGDQIQLHVDVNDITHLMARCDLALGAGGTTSWERCCLGLPTILIEIADNQALSTRALSSVGAVRFLGRNRNVSATNIAEALTELGGNDKIRGRMAKTAATICDGLGARRVAQALNPPTARDGRRISLRPATIDDGEFMLNWQRDPQTRRYFHNPDPPTRDEHFHWLVAKLANPGCLFNIIELDGQPAGIVRFDHRLSGDWEVSVLTAPGFQRLGLARAGLVLAGDLIPDQPLVAEVLKDNLAAHRLFLATGYAETDPGRFQRSGLEMAS